MAEINIDGVKIKKITPLKWEVEKDENMRVPSKIYASRAILDYIIEEFKKRPQWCSLKQLINFSSLPGVVKNTIANPDIHVGYGVPIGGVGAFDAQDGVVTFAGIGFDANCGVRTMTTPLTKQDVLKKQKETLNKLFNNIPAGLGSTGEIKLSKDEIDEVLVKGAEFAVNRGYGIKEDLKFIEENGKMEGAKPGNVSDKAKRRQLNEVGTLGSGNHYLELQYVDKIYDKEAAKAYGLNKNQVVVSLHTGSRALGHQTGTDYLKKLSKASKKYDIPIREKELVCAPINSEEGQKYISAEFAAFNCAFANRQSIAHLARETLSEIYGIQGNEIKTFYEIGHNTCKFEKHKIDGKSRKLLVHRKGSTRAFGPGREEIPPAYRNIGQPVLIGGTMGTSSYILHGTKKGMKETFGSSAHGAGRKMSRNQAKKQFRGKKLVENLGRENIMVKGHGWGGVAEEAPGAYKDVNEVVDVAHKTGISKKVVRTKPLICVKG